MSKETPPPGAVALVHAAKEGLADEAERLLATHPSLIAYRGQGTPDAIVGNTPAHWAAARGHAVVLGALLRAGADTHARNNGDSTPLHSAVLHNQIECARALLAAGADAHLADEFGDSALSLARRAENAPMTELLLGGSEGAPADTASAAAMEGAGGAAAVAEWRRRGNDAFGAKEYDDALTCYAGALDALRLKDGGEAGEEVAALHSNRSACHAALADFDAALADADAATAAAPRWAKAHSRRGAALHGLGDLGGAIAAYEVCDPGSIPARSRRDPDAAPSRRDPGAISARSRRDLVSPRARWTQVRSHWSLETRAAR